MPGPWSGVLELLPNSGSLPHPLCPWWGQGGQEGEGRCRQRLGAVSGSLGCDSPLSGRTGENSTLVLLRGK